MKKIASLLAAAMVFTGISASAQDNTHIYGEFLSKTLIPQKGLCDVQKSYSGHESEDISNYFSGLVSAFTLDLDGDGSDELITVESNLITVYGVDGVNVTPRGDFEQKLITDAGESYANVFALPPYVGYEAFSDNGASKTYILHVFTLDDDKTPKTAAKIEKTISDDGVSEFASGVIGGEVISYSHVINGTLESTVNKNDYADINAAAIDILTKLGFSNPEFVTAPNRLNLLSREDDGNYKTNKYIPDLLPETYVRATNIRLGGVPVVRFEDYSDLQGLSAAITVVIDDNTVVFPDALPVIVNDRTLVPMRQIFEDLGCEVDWNETERKVTATRGEDSISLVIGGSIITVNGKTKEIDVPAQIIKDRTFVPIRAISEAFGYNVGWDGEGRVVVIDTK